MRRTTLMLTMVIALAPAAGAQDAAEAPGAEAQAVEAAVRAFIGAIDRLDLEGVAASFAEDATAFYPFSFTPHRLDGREAIKAAQARAFEWARRTLLAAGGAALDEPPSLGLTPTDLAVHMLGGEAAAVTWHSNRPGRAGRRSAVLHKVGGKWLIVSHHASNMEAPPAGPSEGG